MEHHGDAAQEQPLPCYRPSPPLPEAQILSVKIQIDVKLLQTWKMSTQKRKGFFTSY